MKWKLPVLAAILVAFALRLVNLNGRPIWYDEAFAILFAAKSFGSMWPGMVAAVQGLASDVHPPLYYTLLHFWMGVAGESPFAARFLSVSFGVATVAVLFRLARDLTSTPTAVAAAWILAFAPFHVAYSQEARMYSLLGLSGAAAIWAFVGYNRTRSYHWWMFFVLSGTALLYSHNFGLLVLGIIGAGALVAALMGRDSRLLRATAFAGFAMLVLWLPWLLLLLGQFGKIQQAISWMPRPDLVLLVQTLIAFTIDFDNARVPAALLPFALFAGLVLIILSAYQVIRSRKPTLWFALVLSLAPPLMLYVISQWRHYYVTRALMPSFLVLIVVAAWSLTRAPRRVRRLLYGGLAALACASLISYYGYAEFPRPPFLDADSYLAGETQPGDAIVHDNKLSYFPMHYYDPSLPQSFIADPPGAGSDTLAGPLQEELRIYPSSLEEGTAGRERVWFVIFREAVEQGSGNLSRLNQLFRLDRIEHFNDLELYLYQK